MKLVTILGARPQFVKAAAVSRVFKGVEGIDEFIIHTGQHYDQNMSEIFFEQMEIPKPSCRLNISNLSHGAMTGRMIEQIEKVLIDEKPDWVMVYGDTNSTIAGALAATKQHIKVAHVEAGLRSFNMKMPEEVNRVLTDRVSSLLLCPTDTAVNNLIAEGYELLDVQLFKSGDVMQDAAMYYAERNDSHLLNDLSEIERDFALCTIHRAENTDDPVRLREIVEALNIINESLNVIIPLHPRTKEKLKDYQLVLNAKVIEPVGYLEMIKLLKRCKVVLTDSGGLQKEAYFFAKPCITIRDETEWLELVEAEANLIAGAKSEGIILSFEKMMKRKIFFNPKLYGGGRASVNIANALLEYSTRGL